MTMLKGFWYFDKNFCKSTPKAPHSSLESQTTTVENSAASKIAVTDRLNGMM